MRLNRTAERTAPDRTEGQRQVFPTVKILPSQYWRTYWFMRLSRTAKRIASDWTGGQR